MENASNAIQKILRMWAINWLSLMECLCTETDGHLWASEWSVLPEWDT